MTEIHWYHVVNLLCAIPYFVFLLFSIFKLLQLYYHLAKQKREAWKSTAIQHHYQTTSNTSDMQEILILKPKKYNLHILKQFFFFQMIPFYGLRVALFLMLGFSQLELAFDQVTLKLLHWIAVLMCVYIIGSSLVHNCYFLCALYWAEHVSYHHGLGLTVVESKMKWSRIVFVLFSVLWIIFEGVICGLTIYFVYNLKQACFKSLRMLLHIQYSFDIFLALALGVWFLLFSYNRKRSLFNWNTQLISSDPFLQFVKKKRRQTFLITIVCICLFFFQSVFSLVYFEIYNFIFNVKPIHSQDESKVQMRVLLGFWITKGLIDFCGELVSFVLYFVFNDEEMNEASVVNDNNKSVSFLQRTNADLDYEKNSLTLTPVSSTNCTMSSQDDDIDTE